MYRRKVIVLAARSYEPHLRKLVESVIDNITSTPASSMTRSAGQVCTLGAAARTAALAVYEAADVDPYDAALASAEEERWIESGCHDAFLRANARGDLWIYIAVPRGRQMKCWVCGPATGSNLTLSEARERRTTVSGALFATCAAVRIGILTKWRNVEQFRERSATTPHECVLD